MENWTRDVAYAVRSLLSAKKFSAIVILTLALGLGANTAVFSVLHAVVIRPLPYDDPDRLVRVYHTSGEVDSYMPGPAFRAYRDGSTTLDLAPVYTYNSEGADLTDRAQPERVTVLRVGADYFRVLGVRPVAGQPFARDQERADANVAVVTERIWREYLGGRQDAIGQSLSINGVRQQVVAVLPDTFDDPLVPGVEIWTPIDIQTPSRNEWYNHYLSVVGRLRPSATLAQAQAELKTIASRIESNYGASTVRRSARVTPLQVDTVGTAGSLLWMLLGAVGLLLTIACVNVAGIVLARGAARAQELAVRAALGCSRWRLARQLIIESVLLSLAGGVVGLVSARLVTRLLLAAAPESVARVAAGASGSGVVFAFGFIVSLVAGLAFGLAPALQHARPNLEGVLRESGRGSSGSRRQARFRQVLVVCQIALALVLLTGAGLLMRSFERLSGVDLGLRAENVLTFQVSLPAGRYAEPERRAAFHIAFQERLAAIPGVKAAGAVSRLPVTGTYHTWNAGRTDRPANDSVSADQRVVEGRFFEALGIRILRGRTFTAQDGATPRQVVINDRLARTLYPNEDPIGRQLRVSGGEAEIIGVVADVAVGARQATPSIVYHLHRQFAANRNWGLTEVVSSNRAETAVARRHPPRAPRDRPRARPSPAAHARRRHRPRHRAGTVCAAGRRRLRGAGAGARSRRTLRRAELLGEPPPARDGYPPRARGADRRRPRARRPRRWPVGDRRRCRRTDRRARRHSRPQHAALRRHRKGSADVRPRRGDSRRRRPHRQLDSCPRRDSDRSRPRAAGRRELRRRPVALWGKLRATRRPSKARVLCYDRSSRQRP